MTYSLPFKAWLLNGDYANTKPSDFIVTRKDSLMNDQVNTEVVQTEAKTEVKASQKPQGTNTLPGEHPEVKVEVSAN